MHEMASKLRHVPPVEQLGTSKPTLQGGGAVVQQAAFASALRSGGATHKESRVPRVRTVWPLPSSGSCSPKLCQSSGRTYLESSISSSDIVCDHCYPRPLHIQCLGSPPARESATDLIATMSASYGSASPPSDAGPAPATKRKTGSAGGTTATGRPVKRRASKACQCCRSRKVRCNVVEQGAPCTNCRLDEVECVVTESKRRKKLNFASQSPLGSITEHSHSHVHGQHPHARSLSGAEAIASGSVNPIDIGNPAFRRASESSNSMHEDDDHQQNQGHHVPHTLYASQLAARKAGRPFPSMQPPGPQFIHNLVTTVSLHGDLTSVRLQTPSPAPTVRSPIPEYIKPLPPRMTSEDIHYLWKKGALSIPDTSFRNALLLAYVEFVHPYMPLIELHDFLEIVDDDSGNKGKVSLVLFQAVMFTGTAFVDKQWLERAGYMTRKSARKAFYLKARLLYDFDYETDRIALVQSLLLMTYWYETPDDQKDTWHWMGVAISLAHTIGLHRNPEKSNMDSKKQKLWKRIWWSCFMRDRLVALGMRRPTRIKDEDYDVPMLTLDDFEIQSLSPSNTIINDGCRLTRDLQMQRDLALMCVAKAKLCLIISHVLGAQYSVLVRDQGTAQGQEGNTRSSVMLFPKKQDQTDEVKVCDEELSSWLASVPEQYGYRTPTVEEVKSGCSSLLVQRALLHMVYFATVSALHRPQVLPSAETSGLQQCRDLQDMSRKKVREASRSITMMSLDLYHLRLERYLPTSGVTVLLPAIIIHLLDIKSHNDATREAATVGFFDCMKVLASLRDNYAAADYATQFLEAAIKKADIDVKQQYRDLARVTRARGKFDPRPNPTRLNMNRAHTPPDDSTHGYQQSIFTMPNATILSHHPTISASTPPHSDSQSQNNGDQQHAQTFHHTDETTLPSMHHASALSFPEYGDERFEQNFDDLIDYPMLEGDINGVEMFGFEGSFAGGFGAGLDVGSGGDNGALGESGAWVMEWRDDGLWGPEEEGIDKDVLGVENGEGRMASEERAILLLQGA